MAKISEYIYLDGQGRILLPKKVRRLLCASSGTQFILIATENEVRLKVNERYGLGET